MTSVERIVCQNISNKCKYTMNSLYKEAKLGKEKYKEKRIEKLSKTLDKNYNKMLKIFELTNERG